SAAPDSATQSAITAQPTSAGQSASTAQSTSVPLNSAKDVEEARATCRLLPYKPNYESRNAYRHY
ncbi:unnamed protein product, partial [Rotaria sp. Silwood2]